MPNRKELLSIVELKCYNPPINEEVFPDMVIETTLPSTKLWTSSPIYDASGSWTIRASISFTIGDSDSTSNSSNQVRLVRDAP